MIGRGTYGRVYVVLSDCEVIVVKQIDNPRGDIISALMSQSETLKDLDHPNIVQYLGFEATSHVFNMYVAVIFCDLLLTSSIALWNMSQEIQLEAVYEDMENLTTLSQDPSPYRS